MAKRISELPEFTGTPDGTEIAVFNKDGTTYRATYAELLAWLSGGSGTPGGATTQLQFNNAGAFAGDANMTWVTAGGTEGVGALVVSEINSVDSMFGLVLAGKLHADNDAGFPAAIYVVNSGAADGGSIQASAGSADSTAGNGGNVEFSAGNATAGDGGNINITSGGTLDGNGGSVLVQASSGTTGGGSVQLSAGESPTNPGIATLSAGAATGAAAVGAVARVTGGFSALGNGGLAEVLGGFAQAAGVGGIASLKGGGSVTGDGGVAVVQGGTANATHLGGDVHIFGGQTSDNANRGNIIFGTTEVGNVVVEWARFNRTGEYVSLRRNVDHVQAEAYAATITLDASTGDEFHIGTLTGNVAITVTNPVDGQNLRIRYTQDATGGRTITFTSPTLDSNVSRVTAANATGWLNLRYVASASRYESAEANAYPKTGGAIGGRSYTTPVNVAWAATPTFNAALSNVFYFGTLTANVVGMTINNPVDGQWITIRFKQDSTGGWTVDVPFDSWVQGSVGLGVEQPSILKLMWVSADNRFEGYWVNPVDVA